MSLRVVTPELQQLERELAYSAARSDIEGLTTWKDENGEAGPGDRWYDTADTEDPEIVAKAVRYLDLMGLLTRSPKRESLVQILELPEEPS